MMKRNGYKMGETVEGYLYLLPVIAWIGVFMAFPMYYIIYLSFFKWNLVEPNKTFIGIQNFIQMFTDNVFLSSLAHTVYFTIGNVALTMIVAMLIAILMNQKIPGITAVRGFFYSPVVVSVIAAAMIWGFLFDSQFGPLTQIVNAFGLPSPKWLDDPNWAMNSIIMMSIWKHMGYYAVIYLAALQGISSDYYEAASLDGATALQKFFHVTWPLLRPATMLVVIMGIINSFQVFGQIYVLTAGGPVGSTNVIVYYLYDVAFHDFEVGYASAIGLFLFIAMMVVTLVQFKMMDRKIKF
ncbi:carbohydrate ABC transporter permease [Paenibacillus thalictri]|uniref:Sugar ABC transporter permease n=1 Tax=Paenibacillus thalictri TaxID=2527873 RepID=A0A4Q9DCS8_9BACL|nr:sugar ABC transporter permease [Paenibacillus thalictri]TBL68475.1 sugar ABC transporter permease [Paenibacillus thalictri]